MLPRWCCRGGAAAVVLQRWCCCGGAAAVVLPGWCCRGCAAGDAAGDAAAADGAAGDLPRRRGSFRHWQRLLFLPSGCGCGMLHLYGASLFDYVQLGEHIFLEFVPMTIGPIMFCFFAVLRHACTRRPQGAPKQAPTFPMRSQGVHKAGETKVRNYIFA